MIRAHQHAAGARGSDAASEALGYSKGGLSTKIHLRCEGNGKPVTFLLTVGQRNESVLFERLMAQGTVKRPGRRLRTYLHRHGLGTIIPRLAKEPRRGTRFDR